MGDKILVVEGDDAIRGELRELLKLAGYETVAAATFQQGKQALRSDTPDLMIVDVRLGEFNGLHLVITNPQPIPAIIVTRFADPGLQEEARRLGVDYVIAPFSESALLTLIERKLAKAS